MKRLLVIFFTGIAARSFLLDVPVGQDCTPCTLPFLYAGRLHFECSASSPVKVHRWTSNITEAVLVAVAAGPIVEEEQNH